MLRSNPVETSSSTMVSLLEIPLEENPDLNA
jgi:hypothetical protein